MHINKTFYCILWGELNLIFTIVTNILNHSYTSFTFNSISLSILWIINHWDRVLSWCIDTPTEQASTPSSDNKEQNNMRKIITRWNSNKMQLIIQHEIWNANRRLGSINHLLHYASPLDFPFVMQIAVCVRLMVEYETRG